MQELINEDKFIERHSRQLVLKGWSMELQVYLNSLVVSIPNNSLLLSYLISLGINNFHIQNYSSLGESQLTTNLEESIFLKHKTEQSNVAIFYKNDVNKIKSLNFAIIIDNNDERLKIIYKDSNKGIEENFFYQRLKYDLNNNYEILAACSVFTHKIRQNFKDSTEKLFL